MKKILCGLAILGIINSFIPSFAETVVYNHKTRIYHKSSCPSAVRCTNNCSKMDKKVAIKKGGRPCKKCGG